MSMMREGKDGEGALGEYERATKKHGFGKWDTASGGLPITLPFCLFGVISISQFLFQMILHRNSQKADQHNWLPHHHNILHSPALLLRLTDLMGINMNLNSRMPGQKNPPRLFFSNSTSWHDAMLRFERRLSQVTKKEIVIKSKGKKMFTRRVVKHWNTDPERLWNLSSCRISKFVRTRSSMTWSNSEISSALSRSLDHVASRGPFQPQFFYKAVILNLLFFQTGKNNTKSCDAFSKAKFFFHTTKLFNIFVCIKSCRNCVLMVTFIVIPSKSNK